MLTVDPDKRWSAKQLLSHPWLHSSSAAEFAPDLSITQAELKRFNATRRFKAAVHAVLITSRMTTMMSDSGCDV